MYRDLRTFVEHLAACNELVRVREELSTEYEIAAAMRYVLERKGAAVLFERVRGYDVPVVGNMFGTWKRIGDALGVTEGEIEQAFRNRRRSPVKPRTVTDAPVHEVVIEHDIDIRGRIPVLTYHEGDGGPYFTSALVTARDPESGRVSVGLHRIQVKGRETIGIYAGTPPLSDFVVKAEKKGRPLEIAVASGVSPSLFLSGCTRAPEGVNKIEAAGGLDQSPVEMVHCRSVDLEVPAHAEFILEGELFPDRREPEGPFGESTGYYSSGYNPVARINVITHRKNPLYHALLPFSLEDETLFRLLGTEMLALLQKSFPNVLRVNCRSFTGGVLIVQVRKESDSDTAAIIELLLPIAWVKVVMVVDEDVDIYSPRDVDWALTRVRFATDLIVKPDMPGLKIDPSATAPDAPLEDALTSKRILKVTKIGIDATRPLKELERFKRIDVPPSVKEKVARILKGL